MAIATAIIVLFKYQAFSMGALTQPHLKGQSSNAQNAMILEKQVEGAQISIGEKTGRHSYYIFKNLRHSNSSNTDF